MSTKRAWVLLMIGLLAAGSLFATGAQEKGSASAAQPIVMRLAETHPADYPTTKGDYHFAELVKERTNGRIQIEVYPAAQLGEEKPAIEQVQFGAIDFTRVSLSPVAAFSPNLNALQMPYLYRNSDHMWKVLRGEIGKQFLASLEPAGFIGLGWFDGGARNFYNSKREVKRPSDLKGLKIRVQQSDLMVSMVNALGAVATPMAYGEVYSGLQTGVVDGAENNWPSYLTTSHYEVARFYTIDEHTRVPEIIIASKISMDRLPKADQEIIKQAAWDSMDFQILAWTDYEKVAEAKVRAAGNTITEIPDNSEWQAAMQGMYNALSPDLKAVVEKVRAVK